MSKSSRSGKSGDNGSGLEALGFIEPSQGSGAKKAAPGQLFEALFTPPSASTPARVEPTRSPEVARPVASAPAVSAPSASARVAGVPQGSAAQFAQADAAPLTRRQLRELEMLQSGGFAQENTAAPMFSPPQQLFDPPAQAYSPPPQAYSPPPVYSPPPQAFVSPPQAYSAPPMFAPPPQAFVSPPQTYSQHPYSPPQMFAPPPQAYSSSPLPLSPMESLFVSQAPIYGSSSDYQERGRRGENTPAYGASTGACGLRNSASTAPPRVSASRGGRGSLRKRMAKQMFSGAAMVLSAAFLVGVTVPANAFMPTAQQQAESPAAPAEQVGSQSMAVSSDVVDNATVRAKFTVTSYADLLRQRYGTISYSYEITTGAIRWPFPYVVPISSGFGMRVAPCRGCSSRHMGTDFVPGYGTPIYAVADGIVKEHDIQSWGLGNSVVISHDVKGVAFDSVYAHLATGSVVVEAGQEIKVGDLIGLVGNTGSSTGAHLHFEIHLNGIQVDPFAWLKANVTN